MKALKILSVSLIAITNYAQAATTDFFCAPTNVGQIDSRIHVQCEQPSMDGSNAIIFFAVNTTGSAEASDIANRFLSVGMAALASGKRIRVVYVNGDTSGAAFGCGANNCRKPFGFFLEK